ncbi:MAG TPA: ATP-binding protein [Solirubrobacterales bacterium]|nr:ATP-binding protein [Solirubrobacterales bacterium]
MPLELAQIANAWPFELSLAAAITAQTVWQGRRRTVLNEALHELRRPLQALALAAPAGGGAAGGDRLGASVQMAAAALERLDREINGAAPASARETLAARSLAEAAVSRWQAGAKAAGGSLELRWCAAAAEICGDACEIAQALDNLIVNAIEHGGPRIELRATLGVGWLRLAVHDSGRGSLSASRGFRPASLTARISGRRRRGHGLRVVRRTATAHGGEFALRTTAAGTEARLDLPLLSGEGPC